MKEDLPFFYHDNNARNHPKIRALRAEFGKAGYCDFWILIEVMAESKGACIDISKKINKLNLARELEMNGKELDIFLDFLSDPETDLINIKNGIITADRIIEQYKTVKSKRKVQREKKTKSENGEIVDENDKIDSENGEIVNDFDTNKIKGDKIKENKIKEKDNEGSNEPSQSQKDAIDLATLLLTSHRKVISDYLSGKDDKKTIESWASDIEKLIRIDKKSPETIKQVILWAKTPDNFWFPNIQSGKKLREKYEQLFGKMKTEKGGTSPPKSDKPSLAGLKTIF
jgi:hypothetical protein